MESIPIVPGPVIRVGTDASRDERAIVTEIWVTALEVMYGQDGYAAYN